jgi:adsorption protein B
MGITQIFVPLRFEQGQPAATREFFPQTLGGAVRQRGRWVAGNSLQSWSRHGWSSREGVGLRSRLAQYWFLWRDRKGLWGNPVSLLCNAFFVFWLQSSLVSWALASLSTGASAQAAPGFAATVRYLLAVNFALLVSRIGFRMYASARVYGWRFAAGVLPRMFWGNLVNAAATARAIHLWFAHVWGGRSLAWNKTTHHYPAPAGLFGYKRPLEEILLEERLVAPGDCEFARRQCVQGEDIAQSLLRLRLLSEDQVYEAISVQQGIPLARWHSAFEPGRIAFAIPEALQRRYQAVPYRVESGRLYVAAVHPPSEEMEMEIRRWTRLEVRFHLVSPNRFHSLRERLLREHASYNPEDGTTPSRAIRRHAAGAGAD